MPKLLKNNGKNMANLLKYKGNNSIHLLKNQVYALTNEARSRPCLHGHDRASEETKGLIPFIFLKCCDIFKCGYMYICLKVHYPVY